jgi:hypothetical protein
VRESGGRKERWNSSVHSDDAILDQPENIKPDARKEEKKNKPERKIDLA